MTRIYTVADYDTEGLVLRGNEVISRHPLVSDAYLEAANRNAAHAAQPPPDITVALRLEADRARRMHDNGARPWLADCAVWADLMAAAAAEIARLRNG